MSLDNIRDKAFHLAQEDMGTAKWFLYGVITGYSLDWDQEMASCMYQLDYVMKRIPYRLLAPGVLWPRGAKCPQCLGWGEVYGYGRCEGCGDHLVSWEVIHISEEGGGDRHGIVCTQCADLLHWVYSVGE